MSNQQFTDLDKLHTRTDRWKIRVRVTRMWKPINSKKNCAISIEFVMLDSKGYQIHAVLFEKDFQYFDSIVKEDFVQEGNIYTLEKFDVAFAKDYRPVDNAYKIHFKEGTLVKIATEEANDISKHMFKFVEFDNMPTKASQLTFLIDVIGVLTKVGKARIAAGKLLKEVVIMNKSGLELPITLWEGMTSIIPEDTMKQPNVVIIATSLKAGYYRGKLGLSTLSGTKIYINMDIQYVKDFKQSFDTKKIVVELEDSGQSGGISEQDLLIDRRVDIGKLKEMGRDHSCKGTMYTCKATISYVPDSKWFYTSCVSCKKTVTGTVCTNCSVGVVDRYMLRMTVNDSSGDTTFVAFDKNAEHLIQKPVKELVHISKENGPLQLRKELQRLEARAYVFQVRVTDYSDKDKYESFTIEKIFPEDINKTIGKQVLNKCDQGSVLGVPAEATCKEASPQENIREDPPAKKPAGELIDVHNGKSWPKLRYLVVKAKSAGKSCASVREYHYSVASTNPKGYSIARCTDKQLPKTFKLITLQECS